MSELKTQGYRNDFHRQLLATVSALALTSLIGMHDAKADDKQDRPTVWIELGGQFERDTVTQELFVAPFFAHAAPFDRTTMTSVQAPPAYSIDGEGKITFAPENSNWEFSASVRYGRANSTRRSHHQTPGFPKLHKTKYGDPYRTYTPLAKNFSDGADQSAATHLIADFRAGKDVGLGFFGRGGSSVISAGVRFAQFTSSTDITLHARQGVQYQPRTSPGKYKKYDVAKHTYTAGLEAKRNARAVGPSLSWEASQPIARSDNGASVMLDWGVNAAALFGRQNVKSSHYASGQYNKGHVVGTPSITTRYPATPHVPVRADRSRTAMIPNLGGFAGISLKFPNAKVALGYRADFFFNAMDVGITERKYSMLGFYGPFATIGIGLGE